MPMVGYGAMVVESLLGIVSLVVVGAVAVNGTKPDGTHSPSSPPVSQDSLKNLVSLLPLQLYL